MSHAGCCHIPFLAYGFEVIILEFAHLLIWLLLVTFFFALTGFIFFFFKSGEGNFLCHFNSPS